MLATKGFGFWFENESNAVLPANFNYLQSLRIIGFDTKDTSAAIIGFKRHWLQDTTKGLNTEQMKVLYQLSKKYQ